MKRYVGLWVLIAGALILAAMAAKPAESVKVLKLRIIQECPHDPRAFTQGLAFADGCLYEGTGRNGASTLRQVDWRSGKPVRTLPLLPEIFGEGVTVFRDRIYQLTWLTGLCFQYDKETFRLRATFRYNRFDEGWGMTHDGKKLIVSDGSANLYFLDPETFQCDRTLEVREGNQPLTNLNELEFARGKIYANVWQKDFIVTIDPRSGQVTGRLDCASLVPAEYRGHSDFVLNGIAYDPGENRFFLTGKMWPKLYVVEITE